MKPDSGRFARFGFIVFVALAFLLQSWAVQTHIHPVAGGAVAGIAKSAMPVAAGNHDKSNAPANDDPDNCPLCQAFYAGQYVAPAALVFFLPMAAVSIIEIALGVTPHYDSVSHSWHGRGPPRV